jgi:hypothetical protein
VLHPPYTPERPKRLWVEHHQGADNSELLLSSWDFPDPLGTLSALPGTPRPAPRRSGSRTYSLPVPPAKLPVPEVEVLEVRADEAQASRTVRLRVKTAPSAYRLNVKIPRERLVSWSLSDPLPTLAPRDSAYLIKVVAPPSTGWEVSLRLTGQAPVELLVEQFFLDPTPALEEALPRLPAWTTSNVRTSTYTTVQL